MTDIVWLTDPLGDDRAATLDRLGGKGTGLAEMVQILDLPVPPAFVVTTDVIIAVEIVAFAMLLVCTLLIPAIKHTILVLIQKGGLLLGLRAQVSGWKS